jgi:hypothetical protein
MIYAPRTAFVYFFDNHLRKSWYEKSVLPECYAGSYSIKHEILNHIAEEPSRTLNPDFFLQNFV